MKVCVVPGLTLLGCERVEKDTELICSAFWENTKFLNSTPLTHDKDDDEEEEEEIDRYCFQLTAHLCLRPGRMLLFSGDPLLKETGHQNYVNTHTHTHSCIMTESQCRCVSLNALLTVSYFPCLIRCDFLFCWNTSSNWNQSCWKCFANCTGSTRKYEFHIRVELLVKHKLQQGMVLHRKVCTKLNPYRLGFNGFSFIMHLSDCWSAHFRVLSSLKREVFHKHPQ